MVLCFSLGPSVNPYIKVHPVKNSFADDLSSYIICHGGDTDSTSIPCSVNERAQDISCAMDCFCFFLILNTYSCTLSKCLVVKSRSLSAIKEVIYHFNVALEETELTNIKFLFIKLILK